MPTCPSRRCLPPGLALLALVVGCQASAPPGATLAPAPTASAAPLQAAGASPTLPMPTVAASPAAVQAASRVSGRAELSGVAFAGADVVVYRLGRHDALATGHTDADGRFDLAIAVASGTPLELVASKDGRRLGAIASSHAAVAGLRIEQVDPSADAAVAVVLLTLATTLALVLLEPRFEAAGQAATTASGGTLPSATSELIAAFQQLATAAGHITSAQPGLADGITAALGATGQATPPAALSRQLATDSALVTAFSSVASALATTITRAATAGGTAPAPALLAPVGLGTVTVGAVPVNPAAPPAPPVAVGTSFSGGGSGGDGASILPATAASPVGTIGLAGTLSEALYSPAPASPSSTASPLYVYTLAGGSSAMAGPQSWSSIALDAAGNLYTLQADGIHQLAPSGTDTLVVPTSRHGNLAQGFTVDAAGNIYYLPFNTEKLQMQTPAGATSVLANGHQFTTSYPVSLIRDGQGNLYLCLQPVNRNLTSPICSIVKVAPDGTLTTLATGVGAGGLALDAQGNLFGVDSHAGTVYRIPPGGALATFAGGALGFADGQGTQAAFSLPQGLAIDAAGNLYVADTGNQRIRKITPAGLVSTVSGSGRIGDVDGAGDAVRLAEPNSVAVDAAGSVVFTDVKNGKIRKVDATGTTSTVQAYGSDAYVDATGTAARFASLGTFARDTAGNLYMADTAANTIRKITPTGVVTTYAGTGTFGTQDGPMDSATFERPSCLAFDASGNLYASGFSEFYPTYSSARRISASGQVTTILANYLVQELFADPRGNIFFFGAQSNGASSGIYQVQSDTSATLVATVPTNLSWQLYFAAGANGNFYGVTSTQVYQLAALGAPTLLAGSATAGQADGTGAAASFSALNYFTSDAAGNLFIDDQHNEAVREITPTGQVTTIVPGTSGPLATTQFHLIAGLLPNPAGTLVLGDQADVGTRLIRVISPTPFAQ